MNAPSKSLLVIQATSWMPGESQKALFEMVKPLATNLGMELLISDEGTKVEIHRDLSPLTEAIKGQTDAIAALAASNMALVQAMAEDMGEDMPQAMGLDGRPL